MTNLSAADVQAMVDVVDTIAELSDSTEFELAAELRIELIELGKRVRSTVGLIETQMMNQLEDAPRRFGDRTYEVVDDGVQRADHDAIFDKAIVVSMRRAVNTETGEINTEKALQEMALIVQSLYVSPSTLAKVGGIEAIGLDKRKVRRWEKKGRKLSVVEHHQEFS